MQSKKSEDILALAEEYKSSLQAEQLKVLQSIKGKIVIFGDELKNIMIPDMFRKHIPILAKRYKLSFLDQQNKAVIEDIMTSTVVVQSQDNKKLKELIKQGLISEYEVSNELLGNIRQFKKERQLIIDMIKDQSGLQIDHPEFHPSLKEAIKNRTLLEFLLSGKFISKDDLMSKTPYRYLFEIAREDYNNSYNQLIKDFKDNPDIKYEFINPKPPIYSVDERLFDMVKNIGKHILKNPDQKVFFVSTNDHFVVFMTEFLQALGLNVTKSNANIDPPEKIDTPEKLVDAKQKEDLCISKIAESLVYAVMPETSKEQKRRLGTLIDVLMSIFVDIEKASLEAKGSTTAQAQAKARAVVASIFMEINAGKKIRLGDEIFIREEFELPLGDKEFRNKIIESLSKEKKIASKIKTGTSIDITYPSSKKQKIRNIFAEKQVEEVKEQSSHQMFVQAQGNQNPRQLQR